MKKDNMNYPTLKEIELELFSMFQKCFSQVLTKRFLMNLTKRLPRSAINQDFTIKINERLRLKRCLDRLR